MIRKRPGDRDGDEAARVVSDGWGYPSGWVRVAVRALGAFSSYRFGRVLSLPICETLAIPLLGKQEGAGKRRHPPATGDEYDTGHGRSLSYRGKQLVSRPDHQPIGQRVLQRPLVTAGLPVRRPDA